MSKTFDIFVIMPFKDSYQPIYQAILAGIRRAVADSHSYGRLDELKHSGRITYDLRSTIESCKLCIAEITEPNSNVFYEVGYAEALRKPIVFLTQADPKTLPFDIKDSRVFWYDPKKLDDVFLRELSERVDATLKRAPLWKQTESHAGYVDALSLAAGCGAYFLDNSKDMKIKFMNFAAEQLFGVRRNAAIGLTLKDFMQRIESRLVTVNEIKAKLKEQQDQLRQMPADQVEPFSFETYSLKHPELGKIQMEKIAVAVQDECGEIEGWVVTHNVARFSRENVPETAYYLGVKAAVRQAFDRRRA